MNLADQVDDALRAADTMLQEVEAITIHEQSN